MKIEVIESRSVGYLKLLAYVLSIMSPLAFAVADCRQISFDLINADTDKVIRQLSNGDELNLADLPTKNLNVVANVSCDKEKIGKVLLKDNRGYQRTEHRKHYSLFGDERGDFQPGRLPEGAYTLSATAIEAGGEERIVRDKISLKIFNKRPEIQKPAGKPAGTSSPSGNESSGSKSPSQPSKPIPFLAEWEENMVKYGAMHCDMLKNRDGSFDMLLGATYYDAEAVYYQIGDYTKESKWSSCAKAAEDIYANQYALPNKGLVPGYWNFTEGLTQRYLKTGDKRAKDAALIISKNAAYAAEYTPVEWTKDSVLSREVAYAIIGYLNAEELGDGIRARLEEFVDVALGHLDQWFFSRSAPSFRSFMVGLNFTALSEYHQKTGDPRIIPALTRAADELWKRAWVQSAQAFMYDSAKTDSGDQTPAPDLNLIIAPAYAYLYHQTGEQRFLDRGDAIFAGGVRNAFLDNPKQFNQNYRWSFDYVKWRSLPPKK